MCKYLVGTSISRDIKNIIKNAKKGNPDFDSQREMLCMRLEEYYKTDKAGGGKRTQKNLYIGFMKYPKTGALNPFGCQY